VTEVLLDHVVWWKRDESTDDLAADSDRDPRQARRRKPESGPTRKCLASSPGRSRQG
jgi:hypothetical protein